MTPRDTTTGAVLEETVIPALKKAGYSVDKQAVIGQRLGLGKHKVDVLATSSSTERILISLKWQQVSGTAEQKVPFEVLSLIHAIQTSQGKYSRAYIVLGGVGFSLREFYIGGGLNPYLKHPELVTIVSLDTFISIVNKRAL